MSSNLSHKVLAICWFLVALFGLWPQSTDACKCFPMPEPRHCHTEYLALVKIVDVQTNVSEHLKWYTFKVLEESNLKGKQPLNAASTRIRTRLSSAACGVRLENNAVYLLGGSFDGELKQQPILNSCSYFKQNWQNKTNADLGSYRDICNQQPQQNEPKKLAN